jgi:hypothetical protein
VAFRAISVDITDLKNRLIPLIRKKELDFINGVPS